MSKNLAPRMFLKGKTKILISPKPETTKFDCYNDILH